MDKFNRAVKFAVDKHAKACRKGKDTPFIVHPMEVAAIASTMLTNVNEKEDILCAAVLHDTTEDAGVSLKKITKKFGAYVAELLDGDAEDKMRDRPSAETWKERKEASLEKAKGLDRTKKIIILADKLSNIRDISRDYAAIGDKVWDRFNQKDRNEQGWYYSSYIKILSDLSDTAAYKEYCHLVGVVFPDHIENF
ncbi:MAG: HD domain-containing protein [Parasporobacterium sp.]|nr:HD domain-containing protein [Parasporobacterium sp.]